MIPLRIAGATRHLGAPSNWDEEQSGPCSTLHIRDTDVGGANYMVSRYELTPDELAAVNAGRPIELWIAGVAHPVIRIGVAEAD